MTQGQDGCGAVRHMLEIVARNRDDGGSDAVMDKSTGRGRMTSASSCIDVRLFPTGTAGFRITSSAGTSLLAVHDHMTEGGEVISLLRTSTILEAMNALSAVIGPSQRRMPLGDRNAWMSSKADTVASAFVIQNIMTAAIGAILTSADDHDEAEISIVRAERGHSITMTSHHGDDSARHHPSERVRALLERTDHLAFLSETALEPLFEDMVPGPPATFGAIDGANLDCEMQSSRVVVSPMQRLRAISDASSAATAVGLRLGAVIAA